MRILLAFIQRGFWLVVLAWVFVIYKTKVMFGDCYSEDSYAFYFLGKSIVGGHGYTTPAIRDFYLDPSGPIVSKSYPPLLPLLVGITDFFLNKGVAAGPVINLAICMFAIYLWFIISRRIANNLFFIPFLLPIVFPFMPSYDSPLWRDVMAGRSAPLTLLLFLCALYFTSKPSLHTDNKIAGGIGISLGLLTLTRFDSTPFCFIFPTILFLLKIIPFRKTLFIYTLFIITILPWSIRNFLVFGSFFASSESITAASTLAGIVPIQFYEHGIPWGVDAPQTWLNLRISFFKYTLEFMYSSLPSLSNLWPSIFSKGIIFLYIPGIIYAFIYRNKNQSLWIYYIATSVWVISNILCMSLTSYGGDTRYYTVSYFTVAGGSAFIIAVIIKKIFNFVLKIKASNKQQKTSMATIIFETFICLIIAFTPVVLYSQDLYSNKMDLWWQWVKHAQEAPVKKGEYVAAVEAEKLAYYTGWNTIYFPNNHPLHPESLPLPENIQSWKDYRAWLKYWKPSYLITGIYDFYYPLGEYPHATAKMVIDNTVVLLKINLNESDLTEEDALEDAKVREEWRKKIYEKNLKAEPFYTVTDNFYNGIALKWDGFFVPNVPENQKNFSIGRVVLLPNGEHRLIKDAYYLGDQWQVAVYGGPISTQFTVLPDQFEVIDGDSYPPFFLTNDTWRRGVAIKWTGFMIQNTPANQQLYKIGSTVQLPTKEKRTILSVTNDATTLYVTLSGDPIDGFKVGTPDHFKVLNK